jgi:acetyltransferase-like isoleucine patch superfamily enzyme
LAKESKYFGLPQFSPRERLILRGQYWNRRLGEAWMRWRYRDRVHFGPGCRIDPQAFAFAGLGTLELGPNVIIDRGFHRIRFHLEAGSRVTIAEQCWFQTFIDDMTFATKPGAEITIGPRSWMAGGLFIAASRITIGEHVEVGTGCIVMDSFMHRYDNDSPPPEPQPTTIGSYVWLPSNITIFPGVTIGDHCIIGAGSIVTTSIPPNSIAAGRPARVIRTIGNRDQVDPFQ